jgi:hypothetical protein
MLTLGFQNMVVDLFKLLQTTLTTPFGLSIFFLIISFYLLSLLFMGCSGILSGLFFSLIALTLFVIASYFTWFKNNNIVVNV